MFPHLSLLTQQSRINLTTSQAPSNATMSHLDLAQRFGLTARQAEFVRIYCEGATGKDAYLQAYGCKESAADTAAARTRQLPAVAAAIDYTISQRSSSGQFVEQLSRGEKHGILASIVRDEGQNTFARLAALRIDNEMAGHNAPVQHAHTVSLERVLGLPDGGATDTRPEPWLEADAEDVTP